MKEFMFMSEGNFWGTHFSPSNMASQKLNSGHYVWWQTPFPNGPSH